MEFVTEVHTDNLWYCMSSIRILGSELCIKRTFKITDYIVLYIKLWFWYIWYYYVNASRYLTHCWSDNYVNSYTCCNECISRWEDRLPKSCVLGFCIFYVYPTGNSNVFWIKITPCFSINKNYRGRNYKFTVFEL